MAARPDAVPAFAVYDGPDIAVPLYRVVTAIPPSEADFRSYAQVQRSFRDEEFFRALGMSMWLGKSKAVSMARRGQVGTFVAEVDIDRAGIY